MDTCDPVQNVFVEIWHTDITGTYSGTKSDSHPDNVDKIYGRGFQKTDHDGVISFQTVFPGRYPGRTEHIHVMVHPHAEERSNGTVLDSTASHVGQVYFDQDLIYKVRNTSAYRSTNNHPVTLNEDDAFFRDTAATSDPVVTYVELGPRIEDGLLAWISFGINTTLAHEVSVSGTLTKDGGVLTPNLALPEDEQEWHSDLTGWKTIMKKDAQATEAPRVAKARGAE
ncbi:Intradiol ring-cleavage dioxygenase [Naviculisporaceae sp. PSN 640]